MNILTCCCGICNRPDTFPSMNDSDEDIKNELTYTSKAKERRRSINLKINHRKVITKDRRKESENKKFYLFKDKMRCLFCGGKNCPNEDYRNNPNTPIIGLNADLIDNDIYASQRPSNFLIKKFNLVEKLKALNIGLIINLQREGEHPYCGPNALDKNCGFSYTPSLFVREGINVDIYGWKDMDVPDSLDFMMKIVKEMMYSVQYLHKKVLVHCHAGKGRTGVAIACYLIFKYNLNAKEAVNIVRSSRANCIQNRNQFSYCEKFYQFMTQKRTVFTTSKLDVFVFITYQNDLLVTKDAKHKSGVKLLVPFVISKCLNRILYLNRMYLKDDSDTAEFGKNNDFNREIIDPLKYLYRVLNGSIELSLEKYNTTTDIYNEINEGNWKNLENCDDILILSEIMFYWMDECVKYCISPSTIDDIFKEEYCICNKSFLNLIENYSNIEENIANKLHKFLKKRMKKYEWKILIWISYFLHCIDPKNISKRNIKIAFCDNEKDTSNQINVSDNLITLHSLNQNFILDIKENDKLSKTKSDNNKPSTKIINELSYEYDLALKKIIVCILGYGSEFLNNNNNDIYDGNECQLYGRKESNWIMKNKYKIVNLTEYITKFIRDTYYEEIEFSSEINYDLSLLEESSKASSEKNKDFDNAEINRSLSPNYEKLNIKDIRKIKKFIKHCSSSLVNFTNDSKIENNNIINESFMEIPSPINKIYNKNKELFSLYKTLKNIYDKDPNNDSISQGEMTFKNISNNKMIKIENDKSNLEDIAELSEVNNTKRNNTSNEKPSFYSFDKNNNLIINNNNNNISINNNNSNNINININEKENNSDSSIESIENVEKFPIIRKIKTHKNLNKFLYEKTKINTKKKKINELGESVMDDCFENKISAEITIRRNKTYFVRSDKNNKDKDKELRESKRLSISKSNYLKKDKLNQLLANNNISTPSYHTLLLSKSSKCLNKQGSGSKPNNQDIYLLRQSKARSIRSFINNLEQSKENSILKQAKSINQSSFLIPHKIVVHEKNTLSRNTDKNIREKK